MRALFVEVRVEQQVACFEVQPVGLAQSGEGRFPAVRKAIRMTAVGTDFWFHNHSIVDCALV
jgi:hypothetical protein